MTTVYHFEEISAQYAELVKRRDENFRTGCNGTNAAEQAALRSSIAAHLNMLCIMSPPLGDEE